ncbi:MAG TPA: ankyrin repeat domain-containing protein [Terriglobia bacterium]|nr:ankyrin repeat domain-containing protein [Terriglobia bacterium]
MAPAESILDAIRAGNAARVKELLAQEPGLVNARSERGESAVLLAAYYRRQDLLAILLASGPDLNIYEAAAAGALDPVKAQLTADPSLLNSYAPDGFTPLGLAAFFGHPEIVDFLLAQGAEVNAASRNAFAVMPLHSATASRHLGIAQALVEHRADVNARQQGGYAPLHEAANTGNEEMTRLLATHGANPNARADDGRTPLSIAVSKGYDAVADLLRQRGATE